VDLVNAADGWLAAGGRVWWPAVVEPQEGCQGAVSGGGIGPDLAAPIRFQGAEEAFDLAVPAWRVGRDEAGTNLRAPRAASCLGALP